MKNPMKPCVGMVLALILAGGVASASSHMDAPLITLDDAANTTDVYAFRSSSDGVEYLTTALAVYPFEEPGIGPNRYNFDDNVMYEIHVLLGDNLASGRKTLSYQFEFATESQRTDTILQSYLGTVANVGGPNQNLIQRYSVWKVDSRTRRGRRMHLGNGIVPPNNQGRVTPFYNQGDDGDMPTRGGVNATLDLDLYTQQSIATLADGYQAFAGQRDDGFYADIQSIFDLDFGFSGPNKPFDSQGGFNVHTIALNIPVDEIGGDQQIVGVYATTSRRRVTVLSRRPDRRTDRMRGSWVQVGRQGNPLFCEALVAIADKDLYNRSAPTRDAALFAQYALTPELAAVLGGITTERTDIAGIFIPDVIKVDLSTGPARLAGNPDDVLFHRLGVFGGDTLMSAVQDGFFGDGTVPGGWPNGRRFGDDVVDITVIAVLSDLRAVPPEMIFGDATTSIDGVVANDISYNKVFPYAATPLNGRNHGHH